MKLNLIAYLKRNLKPDPKQDRTDEVLEYVDTLEKKAQSLAKIRAAGTRYLSSTDIKQKRKEYNRAYYLKNKERIKARNKKWNEENKEKFREYAKEWRAKNTKKYAEYYREYSKKWRAAHPNYSKEYYQKLKNSAKAKKV